MKRKNQHSGKTNTKSQWSNLFSFREIKSIEESSQLIKEIFWTFMGVGLLLIGVGIFISLLGDTELYLGFIMDGFVYVVLSLIFFFKKSRIVAVLLLLLAIISVVVTTLNQLGISKGGSNIILAIIVLIAGIHGVRAAFAYHRLNGKHS
jgi:hypothetical protein